jgi:signal recognition particle subunit SRP54
LNGSRRLRIAKGSGTTVTEVNSLVNRFEQAAKMMKTVAKGGMPQIGGQMPGMPNLGGGFVGKAKKNDKKKKGSKSGNPAKRAAENLGITPPQGGSGSSFGL